MQETLFTAARRALRFFNIVMQHGGLVDREFEQAMSTLQKNSRSSDLLAVGAVGLKLLAEILKHLDNGVKFDANAPCNVYGEGLVDGIQNAIERGQRGISTHG